MDLSILRRSVRLVIGGSKRKDIGREAIIKCLVDYLGDPEILRSVWRTEPGSEWIGTFRDSDTVPILLDKQVLPDLDFTITFMPCDRRVIEIRVHWLPLWTIDKHLELFFREFGQVDRISEERTLHESGQHFGNGVRRVRMTIREGDQLDIPYKATIGGRRCLITIQGRPPLCLKCFEVGHFRSNCPKKTEEPTGYAAAARRGQGSTRPPTEVPTTRATSEHTGRGFGDPPPNQESQENPSPRVDVPTETPDTPVPERREDPPHEEATADPEPQTQDGMDTDERTTKRSHGSDDSDQDDESDNSILGINNDAVHGTQTSSLNDKKEKTLTAKEKRKLKNAAKKAKKLANDVKQATGGAEAENFDSLMDMMSPASRDIIDTSVTSLETRTGQRT